MRNPTPSSGQNSQLVHWWVLVHAGPTTWVWDCLDLWCVSYWLLNHFLNIKLNKIETENFTGIWGHSWCCWKALGWVRFNRVHFTILLRCERYCFLSGFCCWKFTKITKIGFGRKNQLSPQYVHTWANSAGYTSINRSTNFSVTYTSVVYTNVVCAIGPSVNPLQNRETQPVNIILQCMYWIFEQPNMKGNHSWIEW
jgi:hypothetical protein